VLGFLTQSYSGPVVGAVGFVGLVMGMLEFMA
jgi:hypothetical protein